MSQKANRTVPLALIIDDSWDAAPNWNAVVEEAENRIEEARRRNLEVLLVTSVTNEDPIAFGPAGDSLRQLDALNPKPLPADHAALAQKLGSLDLSGANIVWMSGGVDFGETTPLANVITQAASAQRLTPVSEATVLLPGTTEETSDGFRSVWHRPDTRSLRTTEITAHSRDGRVLARETLNFAPGETDAEVSFALPSELRTRITALRAAGSASAGSVKLLDDSWGRPPGWHCRSLGGYRQSVTFRTLLYPFSLGTLCRPVYRDIGRAANHQPERHRHARRNPDRV